MPAIVPIILGVQAGISLYQAHNASSAAKDAVKAQTDASNKAMGLEQQQYQQTQQNLQPWISSGQQARNTLTALLTPQGQQGAYNPRTNYGQTPGQAPGNGGLSPVDPSQRNPTANLWNAAQGASQQYGGPQVGGINGMVQTRLVQMPDGTTKHVPTNALPGVLGQGGKVIG